MSTKDKDRVLTICAFGVCGLGGIVGGVLAAGGGAVATGGGILASGICAVVSAVGALAIVGICAAGKAVAERGGENKPSALSGVILDRPKPDFSKPTSLGQHFDSTCSQSEKNTPQPEQRSPSPPCANPKRGCNGSKEQEDKFNKGR